MGSMPAISSSQSSRLTSITHIFSVGIIDIVGGFVGGTTGISVGCSLIVGIIDTVGMGVGLSLIEGFMDTVGESVGLGVGAAVGVGGAPQPATRIPMQSMSHSASSLQQPT
jgi:hypothetical protein